MVVADAADQRPADRRERKPPDRWVLSRSEWASRRAGGCAIRRTLVTVTGGACLLKWVATWVLPWHLENVRPLASTGRVWAKRKLYEVELPHAGCGHSAGTA